MIPKFSFAISLFVIVSAAHAENCFETQVLFEWLPTPRSSFATVYDGDDNIYMIGGRGGQGTTLDGIVRYRLSTRFVTIIARFGEGDHSADGTAQYLPNGEIIYFGGDSHTYKTDMWKIDTADPTPVKVADFPSPHSYIDSVYDGQHSIYAFGGIHYDLPTIDQIYLLNTDSIETTAQPIANLPYPTYGTASVWVNGVAYMFGGSAEKPEPDDDFYNRDIVRFIPANGTSPAQVEVLPQKLITGLNGMAAVVVGDLIYAIGGTDTYVEQQHFLTRFNTRTGDIEHFRVSLGNAFVNLGAVYVQQTHRIYLFGGWSGLGSNSAQIRYIQLSHDENCTLP